jgi:hypothetical protein
MLRRLPLWFNPAHKTGSLRARRHHPSRAGNGHYYASERLSPMSDDQREKKATERRRAKHSATAGIKRPPSTETVGSTVAVLNAALRLWEAKNGYHAAPSFWTRKSDATS